MPQDPSVLVSLLRGVMELLQQFPFATLALLAGGYLAVQGVKAWKGKDKAPTG